MTRFRQQYTYKQKRLVLAYSTTHTNKETCSHFGIHKSLLSKWKKDSDKILSSPINPKSIKPGAGRHAMYPVIEERVHQWALESRREGVSLTYSALKDEMREAVSLAHPSSTFKASDGWVRGYKKRHPSCKLRVPTHTHPSEQVESGSCLC